MNNSDFRRKGDILKQLFSLLEEGCAPAIIEDDLVFSMNNFSLALVQSGAEAQAHWLWKKCISLCDDKSAILYYNYSRLFQ